MPLPQQHWTTNLCCPYLGIRKFLKGRRELQWTSDSFRVKNKNSQHRSWGSSCWILEAHVELNIPHHHCLSLMLLLLGGKVGEEQTCALVSCSGSFFTKTITNARGHSIAASSSSLFCWQHFSSLTPHQLLHWVWPKFQDVTQTLAILVLNICSSNILMLFGLQLQIFHREQ